MENTPVGFRFSPTDEELISFYLRNKLQAGRPDIELVIPVVNIYLHTPWELPQLARLHSQESNEEWFFFVPKQLNMARGGKPNRLTDEGYWKATGSPVSVYSSINQIIGKKKTMTFYTGRARNGKKTDWKINEYKAAVWGEVAFTSISNLKLHNEFTLCRLYKKSKWNRTFDHRPLGISKVQRSILQQLPLPPPPPNKDQSIAILPPQEPFTTVRTDAEKSSTSVETEALWDNITPLWDWEDYFNLV